MLDTLMGITRTQGWDPTDDRWYGPIGGIRTQAGVDVSEDIAMRFVTIYACVAKRAKTVAALPVSVVKRVSDTERQRVDHPLADLLSGQANEDATGLTVRETMMANLDLWGNAYAECIWSNNGRAINGLVPLMSRDVTPKRTESGKLVFEHRPPHGPQRIVQPEDMWHVPGLSFNGVIGLSPIAYNREAIGLGIAASTMAASFFGNGAWAGGIVKRDPEKVGSGIGKLSQVAAEALVAGLEEKLRGPDKAFGIALLREGMTYEQLVSIPLADAQFVQVRGLTRIEICGIFDVPPSMIHDLENGTFNNTEQQGLIWVRDSILPTTVRFEVSAKARFFPDEPLYLRHNLAGLLRGDFKSQMEGFAIGRQWGIFSADDCLELLDRNPVPGGDERLTPLNYRIMGEPTPMVTPAIPSPPQDEYDNQKDSEATVALFGPIVAEIGKRVAAIEVKTIEHNYQKFVVQKQDGAAFGAWLEKFYAKHEGYFRELITPAFESFAKAVGLPPLAMIPAGLAKQYADNDYDTIHAMLEQPAGVPSLLKQWKEHKARTIADGLLNVFKKSLLREESR